MNNVRELERRWLRYKIKQYMPYTLLLVSLVIVGAVLYSLFSINKEENNKTLALHKQRSQATPQDTPSPHKIVVSKKPEKTAQAVQNKVPASKPSKEVLASQEKKSIKYPLVSLEKRTKPLEPSLDFLNKMKKNSVFPEEDKGEEPPLNTHNQSLQYTTKQLQNEKKESSQQKAPQIMIKVKRTSKKELQEIIKRFKRNNNPRLGVFIARKYYNMGDYNKAYNYALLTNQIDSSLEDSWIIFAKSLVKLGQKKRAIKTLKVYIKTSHSNKAQLLLDNILRGKFK